MDNHKQVDKPVDAYIYRKSPMPRQCFLIDDDTDDQEIFLMAMQGADENMSCVVANDGPEAIKRLRSDPSFLPDFIFLDINMPRMNGIQCLAEIRKLGHLEAVPIIMFSTSSEPSIKETSFQLGAKDFLVKPPSIDILIKKLSEVFNSQ